MVQYTVVFSPLEKRVVVPQGTTLLEATGRARITIDSACGGDGICGRCKMIIKEGEVGGNVTPLLTREETRQGMVLACQTTVESDLLVEIPETTRAKEKIIIDKDAQRFRAARPGIEHREFAKSPLVSKVLLEMAPPTLQNNLADYQRIQTRVEKQTGISSMQAGLKIIRRIPEILREGNYTITATLGRRRNIAEIMDLESGDTTANNLVAVVDVGTSTIVAHLVDVPSMTTIGAQACFNSQSTYGREVISRMTAAEKRGAAPLQELLVGDINQLIASLAAEHRVSLRDINAIACAGNTAMMHFLLGLPTRNIRREPYIAAATEMPPFRAAEVGLKINPRGLLFAVPGIGAWVGGDLAAGILATGLGEAERIAMLIDIGTNGEIVLGNREFLMACSSSVGPALEGAGAECGMIAAQGAIERVYIEDGDIRYNVIGGGRPDGICGSGIIDLIAVLLARGIIDRAGNLMGGNDPRGRLDGGRRKFVLVEKSHALKGREISISQEDIQNIITAKAAVFAAIRIMLKRLNLELSDLDRLLIAGGFGNYINLENAVAIGLLPDLPLSKMVYVGNTSIWGAKLAALSGEARAMLRDIVRRTTYYDLMGTEDYVEQFRQAMFLPHTNIELFPSALARKASADGAR